MASSKGTSIYSLPPVLYTGNLTTATAIKPSLPSEVLPNQTAKVTNAVQSVVANPNASSFAGVTTSELSSDGVLAEASVKESANNMMYILGIVGLFLYLAGKK